MQTFQGESLIAAEKVVGSWLANVKWRLQSDGTSCQKFSKSNNNEYKSKKSSRNRSKHSGIKF